MTEPRRLHVAVIVGSLRRSSTARKIAQASVKMLPKSVTGQILEIADLPLYDFDYDDPAVPDKPTPPQYKRIREEIREADGVLFVTSENNRTIPACLKNVIDIGSKPNGDVVWNNKPSAIISHSVGKMGGYSAHKNLKLALSYFKMPMIPQPELFLGNSDKLLAADDTFIRQDTQQFVCNYLEGFVQLVEANLTQID